MTSILGLSAFYHDSAAAMLKNGKIVAAAQEERFSRKKQNTQLVKDYKNQLNFATNTI